jgi:glutaconate CoA-transferase subunit B
VDFITSAGYLDGKGRREKAGLRGKGPIGVVTDIGFMEPDGSGEMVLTALHPGRTTEQAISNTGWALKVAAKLRITEPVTENELRILRQELDPNGIYLKSGA